MALTKKKKYTPPLRLRYLPHPGQRFDEAVNIISAGKGVTRVVVRVCVCVHV